MKTFLLAGLVVFDVISAASPIHSEAQFHGRFHLLPRITRPNARLVVSRRAVRSK